MRFLFGLIIGAVATLMLAPKLASLSPAALEPIGDTLQAVASQVTELRADPPVSDAPDTVDNSTNTDRATVLPALAREILPLPKLAAAPAVIATSMDSDRDRASAPVLTELSQEQSFWVPFRSEASARGFASKLTEQLARQFQVLRAGPGQYLVVFGYSTEAERAEVLAEIHAVTGYTHL
jgi:hypothetical protein